MAAQCGLQAPSTRQARLGSILEGHEEVALGLRRRRLANGLSHLSNHVPRQLTQLQQATIVMDAVRVNDNAFVVIKWIEKSVFSQEVDIGRFLTSPPLSSDPRNHCCPVLDVLDDPCDSNIQLFVMPLLREFYEPKLATVGEAVEFFRQVFVVCCITLTQCRSVPSNSLPGAPVYA